LKSYAESDLNLVCTGKEQVTTQLTTQDNKNIAELNALYSIKVNLQQKTILIPSLDLSFCDGESGDCNCTLDNCKCMFTKDEFFCFSNRINSNVPRFDAERQRIVIDRSTGVTNMQIDQYSQSKGKDIFRKIDLICKIKSSFCQTDIISTRDFSTSIHKNHSPFLSILWYEG
jgi:hypothetical protein